MGGLVRGALTTVKRALLAALLAGVPACGEPPAPRWIHLAEGFRPSSLAREDVWRSHHPLAPPARLTPGGESDELIVEQRLPPACWTRHPALPVWWTPLPPPVELAQAGVTLTGLRGECPYVAAGE